MFLFRILVLCALAVAGAPAAWAQTQQRIVAVVNDDVISEFDVETRIKLVIVSGRLPDTQDTFRRLAPQVLRTLIDEKLQMQEAARRNVTVSKEEIDRAVDRVERQNNMPPGGLATYLQRNGVPIGTFEHQIRASLLWIKTVNRRFRPELTVSDDEIDEALARISRAGNDMTYRLSEIFLAIDSPDDEARVRAIADRLVAQLRDGANFAALAQQFSQRAGAQNGGSLGWVRAEDLDAAVRGAVANLKPGSITDPLRTLDGVRIMRLDETQAAAEPAAPANPAANDDAAKVVLRNVLLPVPDDATDAQKAAAVRRAAELKERVNGCEAMEPLKAELKSPRAVDLGSFRMADLAPPIRFAVAKLPVGALSAPVPQPGGLMLLMVCARDVPASVEAKATAEAKAPPPSRLPDREEVAERLRMQKLEMVARRYLRDVRLAAVVDVRI